MGGCQGNKVVEVNQSLQKGNNHNYQHGSKNAGRNINSRDEFPDMKEWKGERYSGIGIKRMKGYKCNLPIDKLNEKRNEFWRIKNSHTNPNFRIWRVINQACVYDECKYYSFNFLCK